MSGVIGLIGVVGYLWGTPLGLMTPTSMGCALPLLNCYNYTISYISTWLGLPMKL